MSPNTTLALPFDLQARIFINNGVLSFPEFMQLYSVGDQAVAHFIIKAQECLPESCILIDQQDRGTINPDDVEHELLQVIHNGQSLSSAKVDVYYDIGKRDENKKIVVTKEAICKPVLSFGIDMKGFSKALDRGTPQTLSLPSPPFPPSEASFDEHEQMISQIEPEVIVDAPRNSFDKRPSPLPRNQAIQLMGESIGVDLRSRGSKPTIAAVAFRIFRSRAFPDLALSTLERILKKNW